MISHMLETDIEEGLPKDHPERLKFEGLISWLRGDGSELDSLQLKFYTENYRGVHASHNIPKGKTVL